MRRCGDVLIFTPAVAAAAAAAAGNADWCRPCPMGVVRRASGGGHWPHPEHRHGINNGRAINGCCCC